MTDFQHQWLEALALEIEGIYGDDPDSSTTVERICEYIRGWKK